jgi:regulation of enolase protein 1 (concanavalin A-like superfamily)
MLNTFTLLSSDFGSVQLSADGASIHASAKTDLFFHPNGLSRQDNVPIAAFETVAPIISVVARVTVDFVDTYDAGALFIRTSYDQWAKLAFERSPQANPTIVSVVTRGTSDDCDGAGMPAKQVWLRVYLQDRTAAFHYSKDGLLWNFHRTFSLERLSGDPVTIGILVQSPIGQGCHARFENLHIAYDAITDFRSGE